MGKFKLIETTVPIPFLFSFALWICDLGLRLWLDNVIKIVNNGVNK